MRIYVYKMTTDNGGAPCVSKGLLSLAICKPMIRRMAERGSLIFGFGAKNYGEKLIYAAVVTDKLKDGNYYRQEEYARRRDCIYREIKGKPKIKRSARYHSSGDQLEHDVGKNFKRGIVLLSTKFRYFGKKGTANYQWIFQGIGNLIRRMKRGHRVNYSRRIYEDLQKLKRKLWKDYPSNFNGGPSDFNFKKVCNNTVGSSCHSC